LEKLERSASTVEVFAYLESHPLVVVLFIDQSNLSKQYVSMPWVQAASNIVEVDQDILDTFQIGKVPQYRFYMKGQEVASIIGTASQEEFQEIHNKVFSNVEPIR
jgi:hypothetical protein